MIERMYRQWKFLWVKGFYLPGEPEYLFLLRVLTHLERTLPTSTTQRTTL